MREKRIKIKQNKQFLNKWVFRNFRKMVQLVAIQKKSSIRMGHKLRKFVLPNLSAVQGTASLFPLLDRRSLIGVYD